MSTLRSLSIPAGIPASQMICVWGDSTTNGTGAGGASNVARSVLSRAFTPDRLVINLGIGGEPPVEIAARFLARPDEIRDAVHILWFGRIAYGAPSTDFVIQSNACWAGRDHDRMAFLVPAPGNNDNERTPGSSQIVANNAARAELIAAYPDNHIDQMQDMWDAITPADDLVDREAESVGYCPSKFILDNHPSQRGRPAGRRHLHFQFHHGEGLVIQTRQYQHRRARYAGDFGRLQRGRSAISQQCFGDVRAGLRPG